jgi:large subunit ribosomal protein L29
MLEAKELQKQTLDELKAVYRDLSKEIYEMNTEFSIARKLEKPHLLREKKRDRARVLTVLNHKVQGKA